MGEQQTRARLLEFLNMKIKQISRTDCSEEAKWTLVDQEMMNRLTFCSTQESSNGQEAELVGIQNVNGNLGPEENEQKATSLLGKRSLVTSEESLKSAVLSTKNLNVLTNHKETSGACTFSGQILPLLYFLLESH